MPPAPRLVRYKGRFAVQWYDERGRHRFLLGTYDRAEADRRLAQFIAEHEANMRRVDAPVTDAWEDTGASDRI